MAIGDTSDTLRRLKALVPSSWFRSPTPEIDALLSGVGNNQTFIYSLIQYAKAQTRLQSTTDGFVDLAAWDFFGARFQRQALETDASFIARILKEILRERITRKGIIQAIVDLTGIAPIFVEPFNPGDTSAYSAQTFYGCNGTYGSLLLRNQIFIIAYRPAGGGIATVAGWGHGYYGAFTTAYVSLSQVASPVSDAQIYAAIAQTIAAGITAWVQIQNPANANSNSVMENAFVPLLGTLAA